MSPALGKPAAPGPKGPPRGGSIGILAPARALLNRELLAYIGPGFLVTLGFIDPGNWATNMAAGASFDYDLLWVITLSTLMLILFQNMSARLGVVTGKSLAAVVRERFPAPVAAAIAVTIGVACVATQLAEYLGAALGLQILFGIPLGGGAALTTAFVVVCIVLQKYRRLELMLMGFLSLVGAIYVVELFTVGPDWTRAAPAFILPRVSSDSIFLAMGMLGAVVMPHNIYLHSSVINHRDWGNTPSARKRRLGFELVDTVLAMGAGLMVNSSMIIVAAAVFHRHGVAVNSIEQAAETLRPLAGGLASLLFSVALLASGLGSSVTSALATAEVAAGYLGRPADPRAPWFGLTLAASAVPVVALMSLGLDSFRLLLLSQVVLSVQLPITIIPLLVLSRDRRLMGEYASGPVEFALSLVAAAIIVILNALLLYQAFGGRFSL